MTTKLIFFGGGNMAEAIFSGLVHNDNYEIIVIQRNTEKAVNLANKYPNILIKPILDFNLIKQDIAFLAIKPQQAKDSLYSVKQYLQHCTLISVMAGLSVDTIASWLNNHKIIRTMPNTPSSIAKGVTAIYSSPTVSPLEAQLCTQIFTNIGSVYLAHDETEIDKIAPFSSSSIAFTYYFIEGFIKSAHEQFGFNKIDATKFITESIIGACELLNSDTTTDIETQRARVTSKKGMTEQGVLTFEKYDLHKIIEEATKNCYNNIEKKYIPVDLHSHSTYSDGSLSVEELLNLVKINNGQYQALTDHDTVDGITEAKKIASNLNLTLIPGVEISVTWAKNFLIHIVGLGINEQNSQLIESLHSLRNQRIERAKKIAHNLARAGIGGAFEGAMQYCKTPEGISRTHFSEWLVANDYAKPGKAFKKFIAQVIIGYVAQEWTSLENAVKWIRESGGIAVIAHPARYKFTRTKLIKLIDEFQSHGGIGIELISSAHSLQDEANIASLCVHKNLLASVGSDFHKQESFRKINPGYNKALPNKIPSVFSHLGIDETSFYNE